MPTSRRTTALLTTAVIAVAGLGGAGTATAAQADTSAAVKTQAINQVTAVGKIVKRADRNKSIARPMAAKRGWKSGQFVCLTRLWRHESDWNHLAANSSSGAYGIPQALPGSKMASAGKDWRTNARTQIKWGLQYIEQRYGTPCGAWAHFQAQGWY